MLWDSIDNSLMSTLFSNTGIGNYDSITPTYSPKCHLLPDPDHRLYTSTKIAYDQFSKILKLFLVNDHSIQSTLSPMAYTILTANRLMDDGFELLRKIIFQLSPQLGGNVRDSQEQVQNL